MEENTKKTWINVGFNVGSAIIGAVAALFTRALIVKGKARRAAKKEAAEAAEEK